MATVKDLTIEDLGHLIEQKVLEILGDPDSGLELKNDFREELKKRTKRSATRISHEDVLKTIG